MTSKDSEKTRGFLAFRRKKDKVPSKVERRQQSSHSFVSKNEGKRVDSDLKPRNSNAVISKSGKAGKNNRRRTSNKVGPQEVHWYPFYVAVFHDPPDDYYADIAKEELWWSREYLEQRLFEALEGQMMDEEDREHKHRLLQMGQDVVPTRRRSHESIVGIAGDTKSVHEGENATNPQPATTSVTDGLKQQEEGQPSSISNKGCVDTDADDGGEDESDCIEYGYDVKRKQGNVEEVDAQEQPRADKQINSQNADERKQHKDDIAEHERNILQQTQAYVMQYNELIKKGGNVSGMLTPEEVIAAAQKILQSRKSPQIYRHHLQPQPGQDTMTDNEQKILSHTRAYVDQYNELARIGMNLQGMVTPEEAIAAAHALLSGERPVVAEQKQQISLRGENSPRYHFGASDHFPSEHQARAPINPHLEHLNRIPHSRQTLPGTPVVHFPQRCHPIDFHMTGIDPLDRRFWRRSNTNIRSSLKLGMKSKSPYKVRWPKGYVSFVGEPIYVIFDPQEMWWTGPELQYIDMENQRELETRESAHVFDRECELVYDRVIDECQVLQDRRRNPLRDLSALWSPSNLRNFFTPNLIQGLVNGHRGLELGGLEGRREKNVEQYRVVFDYIACNFYNAESRVKKNRQGMGLADAASDATLCDRVFAYMMGLADEMIIHAFDT